MTCTACIVTTVTVMLLKGFEPYGLILINVCVAATVAIIILLMDFGPYGIFMYCVLILLRR
jgi:hypothetical protein